MAKLTFEAIAKIENGFAIAISDKINALFKVDLNNGMAHCLGAIPEEEMKEDRLYTKALYANNKVYFVPMAAKHIAVYNLETNRIYTIKIKEADLSLHPGYQYKSKFNGGVLFGEYIYMLPCTYPGVIRVNTNTDKVEYFIDWINDEKYVFRKSPCVDGDEIFVPSVINNIVFKFNMSTCKGELLHVGKNNNGCWSMCKVGDDFWLAPKNYGPIIKWNPLNNIVKELTGYPKGFAGNGFLFTKIFYSQERLFFIPAYSNIEIEVDLSTETIQKSNLLGKKEDSIVHFLFEMDEYIFLKEVVKNRVEYKKLHKESKVVTPYKFEINSGLNNYNKIIESIVKPGKEVIEEEEFFGLGEYVDTLIKFD